jgi:penicillin-binding protein 2
MRSTEDRTGRAIAFMVVAMTLFGIIGGRLAVLQLQQGQKFLKQAEGNRLRIIPYTAPRGYIKDRHGRVLASNRLSYSLALYPDKMTKAQVEDVIVRLGKLLAIDADEVRKKVAKLGYHSPHPIKVKNDIDSRTIARIAEHQSELTGVTIEPDTIRLYPKGKLAAHMLGYTGEVTDNELAFLSEKGYRQGDILGKTGLERLHDQELRGVNGSQQVEVDARGRPVQMLRMVPAIPGKDLKLNLDLDLQQVAEAALDEKHYTGAVVAINPQNGQVLALASRPVFDPNIFSRKVKPSEWKQLQKANFPFVNRAFSVYPPGSIYKIPMALAALESGKCTPNRLFNSTGSMRVGNRIFHDWSSQGFGVVDIVKSLQWSIDTVYYELGVEMGGDTMSRYAHEAGLGELTGIDLAGESSGLIPDPAWKRRVWHDKWWPGDSANVSIGQGAVSVTPIQAAVMMSTIANGGTVYEPRVVNDGKPPVVRKANHWNPRNVALVHKALRLVVSSGTGVAADVPGKTVSGKTGSAEDGRGKTHGWFACFAPEKNPTIALVVFCESAGHGGSVAAPIARKVLDRYFGLQSGQIRRATVVD